MAINAFTKSVGAVALMVRFGTGFAPAPAIPTIPAMRIEKQLPTESQDRLSRVRGKLMIKVGIAKIPVYHMRHNLPSESAVRLIWPASS